MRPSSPSSLGTCSTSSSWRHSTIRGAVVRRREAGPDHRRPRLEELGGRPLHHRIAPVAASAPRPAIGLSAVRSRRRCSPPIRTSRPPRVRRSLPPSAASGRGGQVRHRHRVVLSPARAAPRRHDRWSGRTSRRAPPPSRCRGPTPRRAATGAYMSVSCVAAASAASPRHGSEDARLDLAEVGTHEHEARLGDDRRSEIGGHVVQSGRRGHPPGGAVRRRPLAAQPSVGADVGVEPRVAERRRDALGLAPDEQVVDERMLVAQLLETPRPGVGHLDARRGAATP